MLFYICPADGSRQGPARRRPPLGHGQVDQTVCHLAPDGAPSAPRSTLHAVRDAHSLVTAARTISAPTASHFRGSTHPPGWRRRRPEARLRRAAACAGRRRSSCCLCAGRYGLGPRSGRHRILGSALPGGQAPVGDVEVGFTWLAVSARGAGIGTVATAGRGHAREDRPRGAATAADIYPCDCRTGDEQDDHALERRAGP